MITKKEIKESNLNPDYIQELGEAIAKEGQKDAMGLTYILEKAGQIERYIIRLRLIQKRGENEISKEEQQKLEKSLKHLHQEITEHIHPYVATKIEKIGGVK